MPRSSQAQAARTRAAIAEHAADLGSAEGLESVTIGRLASELELSKGGVIGPFGSKQELQLAALEAGIERFRTEVWEPVARLPAGRRRLTALIDSWFSYLEREVFPGGCFLTAAAVEFDDRPGPVRDLIASTWARWLELLEHEAGEAQRKGELAADLSAGHVAFQLNAQVMAGNWNKQLYGGADPLGPARAGAAALLAAA